MTKDAVRRNIRYNEDLVRSYQKSINEKRIQIQELTQLKGKITSYKNEFAKKEKNRKNKLSSSVRISLNIFGIYMGGIQAILNGIQYRKAMNGLDSASGEVQKRINSINGEINSLEGNVRYRKQRISYWQRQLRYAD